MSGWWDVAGLTILDVLLWALVWSDAPTPEELRRLWRHVARDATREHRPPRRQHASWGTALASLPPGSTARSAPHQHASWGTALVPLPPGSTARSASLRARIGGPLLERAAGVLRRLTSHSRRRRAVDRLRRAGLEWEPEVLDVLALAAAAGGLLGAAAAAHLGALPGATLGWSLCAGGIGYLTPGVWVRRRGKMRGRDLERALPDALDVMVIGLRAGLSLQAAIAEYARSASGVAAEAFRGYLADLALGQTPEEGMAELTRRHPGDELSVVAAALAQSLRLGAPLADALDAQASHFRSMALRRAEEAARALSARLVLPLVACIFPQVFIIGLGPVILRLVGPGGLLR